VALLSSLPLFLLQRLFAGGEQFAHSQRALSALVLALSAGTAVYMLARNRQRLDASGVAATAAGGGSATQYVCDCGCTSLTLSKSRWHIARAPSTCTFTEGRSGSRRVARALASLAARCRDSRADSSRRES
jgi:hypothetical protein